MGVGDTNEKSPPRRRASTEKLIRRIENCKNDEAFDPSALLRMLEGDEEDGDEVSVRGDPPSRAHNEHDAVGNVNIRNGRRGAGAAGGGGGGGGGGRQQRRINNAHWDRTSMSTSVMSRQSRQSNATMITHINNGGDRVPPSPGASVRSDNAPSFSRKRYAPPRSVVSRQSNATMLTHINNNSNGNTPSSMASIDLDDSSYLGRTSSAGSIASVVAATRRKWRNNRENINKWMAASVFLLLFSLHNVSVHRRSLEMYRNDAAGNISPSTATTGSGGGDGGTDVPFYMCDRETPFRYSLNPATTDRSNRQRPREAFRHDWPKQNKLLLLRNDGKFGYIGNQMNSLLHAFDYARDHNLHLGMLFHSWAMDVIQSMFYETDDFDALGDEMMNDFGILVVRNQTQLAPFDEVVSQNAQQLYFYKSSNKNMDHWRETMEGESFVPRRIANFGLVGHAPRHFPHPSRTNFVRNASALSSQVDNQAVILPVQSRLRLRPQRIEGAGRLRDARHAVQGARGRCEILG
jgi:hypothetical protein